MPLLLEVKKKMLERSPRVKALDFHPVNKWVVFALYSGCLSLHDYSTSTCIRTLEASTFPLRAVKFLVKKQWILTGSDDKFIRVFNYNTMDKVNSFEAHSDFIRANSVHPTETYLHSSSDATPITVWNH